MLLLYHRRYKMSIEYNGNMSFSFTDESGRDPVHDSARFIISDFFEITGKGLVVTGLVDYGVFNVDDVVILMKKDGSGIKATIKGIEAFRKTLYAAEPGQNVGLLLGKIKRSEVADATEVVKV